MEQYRTEDYSEIPSSFNWATRSHMLYSVRHFLYGFTVWSGTVFSGFTFLSFTFYLRLHFENFKSLNFEKLFFTWNTISGDPNYWFCSDFWEISAAASRSNLAELAEVWGLESWITDYWPLLEVSKKFRESFHNIWIIAPCRAFSLLKLQTNPLKIKNYLRHYTKRCLFKHGEFTWN